jgi:hypothetical protein
MGESGTGRGSLTRRSFFALLPIPFLGSLVVDRAVPFPFGMRTHFDIPKSLVQKAAWIDELKVPEGY